MSGVKVRRVNGSAEDSAALRADLVVDATGRRSRLPDWLDRARLRPARRDPHRRLAVLRHRGSIAARPVRRDWKGAFIQAKPPTTGRMAAMFEIEGDRLLLTVQGVGGDHPPRDDAGFLAFARSLRSPVIHETIRDAEPLTPVVGFANTANRRRHYERLRRWPERLLAVGDSVCALQPGLRPRHVGRRADRGAARPRPRARAAVDNSTGWPRRSAARSRRPVGQRG